MKSLKVLLILILYVNAYSEIPLEEMWSVDFSNPKVMSKSWIDEEDNANLLVGDGWRFHQVTNGEISWSSDSLIGEVTALARIPYTDGEQFLATSIEPIPWEEMGDSLCWGYLYRFDVEQNMEQISQTRLFDYTTYFDYVDDRRVVSSLDVIPEMLYN